jgi:hypothetical protein
VRQRIVEDTLKGEWRYVVQRHVIRPFRVVFAVGLSLFTY